MGGSGKQVDISSLIAALATLESSNKVSLERGKSRCVGHQVVEQSTRALGRRPTVVEKESVKAV